MREYQYPRVPHRQRLPTPNSQRQPTLPQNPPVSLISPLPLQKPPESSPRWNLPAPIRMDLTPHNSSGRPKTPHSYYPPLQPPYLSSGPSTTEHQWQAQNSTQSTPTLPTSIPISSILPSCPMKISSVISWMLSRTL